MMKKRVSAELTLIKKGPLRVQGNFVLLKPNGDPIEVATPQEAYLCMCGHSQNKPFCDGSHKATIVE